MVRQCVWEPEAAAHKFGCAGGAGVDRRRRSLQFFFRLQCVIPKSNFTVSALSERIRLENLEASPTFRMGCHVVTTRGNWTKYDALPTQCWT